MQEGSAPTNAALAHVAGPARAWPLWLACGAFAVALALIVYACIRHARGMFMYPIDDTYIHLSIARTLAEHGEWGLQPGNPSSCASSLVWPVLLAAAWKVAPGSVYPPLVLASLASLAAIVAAHLIFRREGVRPVAAAVALLAVVFLTPLVSLSLSGMEHTAQGFLDLAFLYLCCVTAFADRRPTPARVIVLGVLAASVTAIRFEGMFLVGLACAMFALRRRFGLAVLLAACAAAPLLAHGFASMHRGGFFLPNSVVLKGNPPSFATRADAIYALGGRAARALFFAPWLAGLVGVGVAVVAAGQLRRRLPPHLVAMLVIALLTALAHVQFAATGWLFRYESYLMVLLIVPLAVAAASPRAAPEAPRLPVPRLALVAVALCALWATPFALWRGVRSFNKTAHGSGDIYNQQYQMALFIKAYYPDRRVAANDVGIISFFPTTPIVDVFGLADTEVARLKKSKKFSPDTLEDLCRRRGVAIAMVYDKWLEDFGGIPRSWQRVGTLKNPQNWVAAEDTVTFYAVDPAERPALERHLAEFARRVPSGAVITLDPVRSVTQISD